MKEVHKGYTRTLTIEDCLNLYKNGLIIEVNDGNHVTISVEDE